MFSSTLKDIIQVQSKTNQWIRKHLMITCLKDISGECFSFNVVVKATLKFVWALKVLLEHSGALAFRGTWARTWTLQRHLKGTRRALEQLSHSDTRALRALGHLGAQCTQALVNSNTWALRTLEYSRHFT